MSTLALTYVVNTETGALLRRLAKCIELAAANVPDKCGSGASTVLTIDNAPATGVASVQITSGPYTSALFIA